jgi:NADH-quinone oxidoreductase subunit A
MSYELAQFAPIAVLLLIALVFGLGGVFAPSLIGKRRVVNPVKDSPYECGMPQLESSQPLVSVRFYLVAMLFILFDLEVVFVVSWATVFQDVSRPEAQGGVGPVALWAMVAFLVVLEVGHFYIWKRGALSWGPPGRQLRAETRATALGASAT